MAYHVIVEFNLDKSKVFRDDLMFPENLYLALAHRYANNEQILRNYGIKILNEHHSSDCNAQAIAALPELYEYGHDLAMLVLQSDLYQRNDVREVVDNLLTITTKVEGKEAP